MDKAAAIVTALGGARNIVEIEPCTTRLRTQVSDPAQVDEAGLRAAGAVAVLRSGVVIQVVVGTEADILASDIEDLL